ncbi:SDR family NAD(P)-dependent oxidoreductase [Roseivivax isoporae]|uniref:Oxidoreductase n=1 Tax=Roseivivax isoporae LMG 25204 TaxID=1449351 RepID=X7FAE3_9RHOB|nr:SDR family NAD(P)-dependent oxidoreductase [Roseivivax isoporae]ETX29019.1 oxidoreductase [Roseivivax isoporae LMG 25204]
MSLESPLAVVTGASSGIGRELARLCADDVKTLILTADEPDLSDLAIELDRAGVNVEVVKADLGTPPGVQQLLDRVGDRPIDCFMANAGVGLGHAFVEQDLGDIRRVINVNVTGTTMLLHEIARRMRDRGTGRILVTGSIAGLMPGSYQAVYNATKAYLDSLSYAVRNELQGSGVTITCLMPGPTETEFFDRADMQDTPVGQSDSKDDPAMVAREGYAAMKKGQSGVVTGFMNKVQATFAGLIPDTVLARMHRRMAEPEDG